MMAVEALHQAGGQAKEYAALYLRHENTKLTEAESVALEAETNEGARFQATMFAKIYAEFVGAVEDFGALCFAIRHRGADGILSHYLASQVGEVGTFFDHVLNNTSEDLSALMKLPDLASIQRQVKPDMFTILSNHYTNAPKLIAEVAAVYRTPPLGTVIRDLSTLPPDWPERIHMLVEAPDARRTTSTKGAIPQVFNKVKHRFMLIESPDEYAKLPTAAGYKAVAIEKTGPKVQVLIEAVGRVSMGAAEIAAVIIALDGAIPTWARCAPRQLPEGIDAEGSSARAETEGRIRITRTARDARVQ